MEATSAPRPHGLRIPKPRRLLAALSDERLVEHVRNGDTAAFEVLYDRHSVGILGFCRHMLSSATDAEDAVQHTFIAAHADIQRAGDRDLHVKAWLYTIARNRCLSMLRARREQVAAEPIEIVTDTFAHDIQQRDDVRSLLADVRKLPDEQREALVLAEVGDLSHEEIGSILGCEANKVKSLVFQARSGLIDRRVARETSCTEIREQLATLRGGALRRSHLRHHLEACPGCTEYREQVRRQRAMLAVALPVIPSAALKSHVLGSVGIGSGTAAAGGAGAAGLGFAQAGVAKLAIAAVVVAGGAGTAAVAENGGVPLLHKNSPPALQSSSHASQAKAAAAKASAAHGTAGSAASAKNRLAGTTTSSHKSHRSASGTKHGFTPTTGGSNGAAAQQRAATRGNGNHSGITKTHTRGRSQLHKKTVVRHVAAPPATVKAAPKAHVPASTPKSVAPKASQPQATAPAPTTTPAPTPAPAPQAQANPPAGSGGGAGKLLGNGKSATPHSAG